MTECECAPVTVSLRAGLLQFSPAEQARDDAIAMVWDQVSLNIIKTMTLGGGGRRYAGRAPAAFARAGRACVDAGVLLRGVFLLRQD